MPDLLKARRSELSIRPFLDILYSPPESLFLPVDDTIICRCEEVRAGDIRRFAALGCAGPNRTKVYGRCGMGPCQGRNCGLTVTEILAAENSDTQDVVEGVFEYALRLSQSLCLNLQLFQTLQRRKLRNDRKHNSINYLVRSYKRRRLHG